MLDVELLYLLFRLARIDADETQRNFPQGEIKQSVPQGRGVIVVAFDVIEIRRTFC